MCGDFRPARRTPPGPKQDPRRRAHHVRSAIRVTLERPLALVHLLEQLSRTKRKSPCSPEWSSHVVEPVPAIIQHWPPWAPSSLEGGSFHLPPLSLWRVLDITVFRRASGSDG
ncbi:Schlafen Family Member 13 [Manis pentadactyla]|nr:Schlafen Family Member 13 [Manis pentadactyla]